MLKSKNFTLGFVLSVLSLFASSLQAQTSVSSPYSAFGLGNLSEVNNIKNRSMGGLSIGTRDYFTVNVNNPASYSAFDSTSFLFEGGVQGHFTSLQTDDMNEKITSGTLSHLLFGFPVMKRWHSSFGLLPFSFVGYNINDYEYKPNIGNTQYAFEGDGGISRFFWGNSFSPAKFLSLGINANYLFGTIDRIQKVTFPDSTHMLSTIVNHKLTINDISWDLGMQVHGKIKNKIDYVVGATYRPQINMNARRTDLIRSYLTEISGVPIILDTILNHQDEAGIVTMPQGYGLGFSLARGYNWQFGLDYIADKWSDYRSFGAGDSLNDSYTIKFGGHIIPNSNSVSYYNRIDYRFGAHYSKTNLTLRNKQINDIGITFGLGLPVKSNLYTGSRSMVNLGIEVGRRGTLENSLIKENYVRVFLGVSIFERWFIKRRYK